MPRLPPGDCQADLKPALNANAQEGLAWVRWLGSEGLETVPRGWSAPTLVPREISEGAERTHPCGSEKQGGAWRPRHAFRSTAGRRALPYGRYGRNGRYGQGDRKSHPYSLWKFPRGRSAPTRAPRETPEGTERTRSYASVQVIAPKRIPTINYSLWLLPR